MHRRRNSTVELESRRRCDGIRNYSWRQSRRAKQICRQRIVSLYNCVGGVNIMTKTTSLLKKVINIDQNSRSQTPIESMVSFQIIVDRIRRQA